MTHDSGGTKTYRRIGYCARRAQASIRGRSNSYIAYRISCIAYLILSFSTLFAQHTPPLRGPLLITGTFGELRSNHYHAGLDFRGSVGTPVYATAAGYVSRITISGGGYGQAIYIDHPDGLRSVYCHLEVLAPELKDTIRTLQYARESFEIDLRLDSTDFPVQQGQVIGGVGNRGHSFGPHLHFEIREIAGDAPLNPMALGFSIQDTRAPQLRSLRLYELSEDGRQLATKTFDLLGGGGVPDTVTVSTSRIGVGIKAFDRQNAMPNWNGIYAARLLAADTTEVFSFAYDRIPYNKTEYLNALTDYADWQRNKSWYYLLYAGARGAMFWREGNLGGYDGTLSLLPNQPLKLRAVTRDFAGNESEVDLVVVHRPGAAPAAPPPHQYYLPAGEPSIIDNGDLRLELKADALYTPLYLRYYRLADESDGRLSDTYQLHDIYTPLHGRAELALRPRRPVPVALQPKAFIGRCGTNGQISSVGGKWQPDGRLGARIGSFGDYAIMLDTIAPTIRVERFGTDLRRAESFSVLIDDEVEGSLSYRATIDGQWALMEYDAKSSRLTHTFEDDRISGGGEHRFELLVTDGRGNQTTFTRSFRR